jgi:acyl-CoA thioesterase I
MIATNRSVAVMAALLTLASAGACRRTVEAPMPTGTASPAAVASGSPAANGMPGKTALPSADTRPVVLFVGTSLTAGYGLDPDEAFPALVQKKIDAAGLSYRVVNAGVSGETSAGARTRIEWLLRQPVSVLVLETGANDALRGQDPRATRDNIQFILDATRRREPAPRLLLVAMEALPNYGEPYRREFRAIYPELAKRNGARLVPFLLAGVAGDPRLNQADGIHPNAAGEKIVAENLWKVLRPLL